MKKQAETLTELSTEELETVAGGGWHYDRRRRRWVWIGRNNPRNRPDSTPAN
jgi:hypothetical protein